MRPWRCCARTTSSFAIFAATAAFLLACGPVWSIAIDGYDSDWTTWDTINDDPNESSIYDAFDIDVNLFKYQTSDDAYYFYWRTYDPYWGMTGDYSLILIDADKDSSTGGSIAGRSGLEYYLRWDLGDQTQRRVTGYATLYVWNSGSNTWQAGSTYKVARGDDATGTDYSFVEWRLPRSAIGTDSFYWAAYYDNATTVPDDYCPDTVSQEGFIPEPGSAALLLLGLAGVAAFRRRRRPA